jgi:hypothetical protein
LVYQFPRDPQGSTGLMGKGLSASQPSVGRANRAGRREHGAIPIKHDERSILIGQPAERCERYHPIGADHD